MLYKGYPTVQGAVDRGASLERLSQYRGEKEILYPPMSYLEAHPALYTLRPAARTLDPAPYTLQPTP